MVTSVEVEKCRLTKLGKFASLIPISVHLSRLLFYSIALGDPNLGVILTAALSQNFYPFKNPRESNQSPDDFNRTNKEIFVNSVEKDYGMYSEPVLFVKLFVLWNNAFHRRVIRSLYTL